MQWPVVAVAVLCVRVRACAYVCCDRLTASHWWLTSTAAILWSYFSPRWLHRLALMMMTELRHCDGHCRMNLTLQFWCAPARMFVAIRDVCVCVCVCMCVCLRGRYVRTCVHVYTPARLPLTIFIVECCACAHVSNYRCTL